MPSPVYQLFSKTRLTSMVELLPASSFPVAPPAPGPRAGVIYSFHGHMYPYSGGVAAFTNQVYLMPFRCPTRVTWSRIGLDVLSGAAAGSKARLAIYQNSPSGSLPLVLDAGEVPVDTTSQKELVISQQLIPGNYFLAVLSQSTFGLAAQVVDVAATGEIHGFPTSRVGPYTNVDAAVTYGTFPSVLSNLNYHSDGVVPFLWLRT